MSEPIQWVYVAGKECAYCKSGLAQRMDQLLDGKARDIKNASEIMHKECDKRWAAETIRNIYYRECVGISTGLKSSIGDDWMTPKKYIEAVNRVLGEIDLDPASSDEANKTVNAKGFYTKEDDGLEMPWSGRIFMNPPYGKQAGKFVGKLLEEFNAGNVTEAITLLSAYSTDTDWFEPLFVFPICFVHGRIKMDLPQNKQHVAESTSANIGSCFVYLGPNRKEFAEEFSNFGNVVIRYEL